jgi:hypothetical protein
MHYLAAYSIVERLVVVNIVDCLCFGSEQARLESTCQGVGFARIPLSRKGEILR